MVSHAMGVRTYVVDNHAVEDYWTSTHIDNAQILSPYLKLKTIDTVGGGYYQLKK
eukprot:SAG25_NODE_716_length_5757_cov_173.012902_1_plen_55_part_00